ncbi:CopD family protein [Penaeicola halotolerans]|uniref:CopD family protein n=1 Tax=Penaeicola halotolerans TaxID=2793196 RepID=UPI001CF85192|nr:CopD family protein [Penaeicola halotolerans]
MAVNYIKALHIIFIVTWFAGLFYIVRLFIYHTEALEDSEPKRSILSKQFQIMSKRLWLGITWPSAVLTLILGVSLLYYKSYYLEMGFMHAKLGFVLLLYIYHFACHILYKQLQNEVVRYSSTQLRIWNEVATILLVAIVFLIVLQSTLDMVWGLVGLVLFSILIMLAIRVYKRIRESKS